MTEQLSEEQLKLIDKLAGSVSQLCHAVIRQRLRQFFEAIGKEVAQLGVIYECCNDACPWRGLKSETVHPKHEPGHLLCPECHEVVERV